MYYWGGRYPGEVSIIEIKQNQMLGVQWYLLHEKERKGRETYCEVLAYLSIIILLCVNYGMCGWCDDCIDLSGQLGYLVILPVPLYQPHQININKANCVCVMYRRLHHSQLSHIITTESL